MAASPEHRNPARIAHDDLEGDYYECDAIDRHGRVRGHFQCSLQHGYLLKSHRWRIEPTRGYVVSTTGGREVRFHDLVLPCEPGYTPDHINSKRTADNRISNLRPATPSEQNKNRYAKKGKALPQGVRYDPASDTYTVSYQEGVNNRELSIASATHGGTRAARLAAMNTRMLVLINDASYLAANFTVAGINRAIEEVNEMLADLIREGRHPAGDYVPPLLPGAPPADMRTSLKVLANTYRYNLWKLTNEGFYAEQAEDEWHAGETEARCLSTLHYIMAEIKRTTPAEQLRARLEALADALDVLQQQYTPGERPRPAPPAPLPTAAEAITAALATPTMTVNRTTLRAAATRTTSDERHTQLEQLLAEQASIAHAALDAGDADAASMALQSVGKSVTAMKKGPKPKKEKEVPEDNKPGKVLPSALKWVDTQLQSMKDYTITIGGAYVKYVAWCAAHGFAGKEVLDKNNLSKLIRSRYAKKSVVSFIDVTFV